MQSFNHFVAIFLIAAIGWSAANPAPSPGSGSNSGSSLTSAINAAASGLGSNVQEIDAESPVAGAQQAAVYDLSRFRKSAPSYGGGAPSYGGAASIPAPPCPKNYLFSCQPNLSPVACAAPAAGGYGSVGAYSAPVPTYVAPLSGGYAGLQQQYGNGAYVAPGYGYGHQNHLYSY